MKMTHNFSIEDTNLLIPKLNEAYFKIYNFIVLRWRISKRCARQTVFKQYDNMFFLLLKLFFRTLHSTWNPEPLKKKLILIIKWKL